MRNGLCSVSLDVRLLEGVLEEVTDLSVSRQQLFCVLVFGVGIGTQGEAYGSSLGNGDAQSRAGLGSDIEVEVLASDVRHGRDVLDEAARDEVEQPEEEVVLGSTTERDPGLSTRKPELGVGVVGEGFHAGQSCVAEEER